MSGIALPALSIKPPEDPLTGYAKALSIRGMQQQQQTGQQDIEKNALAIQQQKQMMQDQQTIRQTLASTNGDMDAALPQLAGKVNPAAYQALVKTHVETMKERMEMDTKALDLKTKRNDQLLGLIDQAKALPPDQYAAQWPQIAARALEIHPDLKGKIDPSQPVPQQGLDTIGIGLMTDQQYNAKAKAAQEAQKANDDHAAAQAALPGTQAKSEEQVRANYASQLAGAKDQADYEARLGDLPMKYAKQFPQQFNADAVRSVGMTPHEQATVPLERTEMTDYLRKNPGKTPSDFAAWKATLAPTARISIENGAAKPITDASGKTDVAATAKKFGMSADAFDQTAEKYFQTGQLPPLGRGISGIGLQRALMNRTAELHPEGDIAGNATAFKANAESLKKLQTNFDQVSAFENTAKKNIDLLQETAQKIPDLGTRFGNIPIRAISGKMMGTPEMAAFKTALNTAQTEAAKVLNSSNASGVLSDSARHELQDIVDGNMTYPAMVASLNTLKQDMSNRHESYQQQITDIQGRLKGKGQQKQGGNNGGAMTITLPSGKTVTIGN